MISIQEYQNKTIKRIEELVSTAGVLNADLSDRVRELARQNPDGKDGSERMITGRSAIYDTQDAEAINKIFEGMSELITGLMNEKHAKETQEAQKNADGGKEHYRKVSERENKEKEGGIKYKNNELDGQKESKKREEENKKGLEESENKRDEKGKKEFISEVEMELIKENIPDEGLSERVRVSDGRDKIRKADGFSAALSMKSNLIRITGKFGDEFTCASCGEKKEKYYNYPTYEGKKYCSAECWNKGEDKKTPTKNKTKINNNNFGFSSIDEFFAGGNKMGITKIEGDIQNNKLVIECGNNRKLDLNQSGLTSKQQQELTNTAKANAKPITIKEIKEINNNNERENGKISGKDNSAAIIGGVAVVGLVLAAIIGVVIYASRRKD